MVRISPESMGESKSCCILPVISLNNGPTPDKYNDIEIFFPSGSIRHDFLMTMVDKNYIKQAPKE